MKLGIVSTALSLLVSATAFGQTSPSSSAAPETLTAGGSVGGTRISGWLLAPTVGTTVFGDRVNYTPGLRAGVYLNKRFAVGLTAQGVLSSKTEVEGDELQNFGSYGGLFLQYIWRSDQLIHATAEATVGDGRWCAGGPGGSDACSRFMIVEPVANMEINVARHVRLATGVGYRFAAAGRGEGVSSRDASGMVIRSSLIFGSF